MGDIWSSLVLDPLRSGVEQLAPLVGGYGWSLFALGVVLRLISLPLFLSTANYTRRIAAISGELAEIRRRYAGMPGRISSETTALYARHGINPVTGCLAGSLQGLVGLVVFVAVYQICTSDPAFAVPFLWLPRLDMPRIWPLADPLVPYLGLGALQAVGLVAIQLIRPTSAPVAANQGCLAGATALFGLALALVFPAGATLYSLGGTAAHLLLTALTEGGERQRRILAPLVLALAAAGLVLYHGEYGPLAALAVAWYVFELVQPRLRALGQPERGAVLVYAILPRLVAAPLLWTLFQDPALPLVGAWLGGDPGRAAIAAMIGQQVVDVVYQALLHGVSLELALRARRALLRAGGNAAAATQLEVQQRRVRLDGLLRQVDEAERLAASDRVAAHARFEAVVREIEPIRRRSSEENGCLGRAYLGLGRLDAASGRPGPALENLRRSQRLGHPDAAATIAQILAELGQTDDEAVSAYLDILSACHGHPRGPEERVILATLERACAVPDDAPDAVRRSLVERNRRAGEAAPSLAWPHRNQGVALLALGQATEALQALTRAAQLDPDQAATHELLGLAAVAAGAPGRAADAFRDALQLEPGRSRSQIELARLELGPALEDGDRAAVARGAATLEALARREPLPVAASVLLGRAYQALDRHVEAIPVLEDALRQAPRETQAQVSLAFSYRAVGRTEDATRTVRQAIAAGADDAAVRALLGDLLYEAGQYQQAVEPFRDALRRNPHLADARRKLGLCLFQLGSPSEAAPELARVADEFSDARLALGRCQIRLGEADHAIATLTPLADGAGDPDVPLADAWYYLGCAYAHAARAGAPARAAQACSAFERCLQAAPERWRARVQLGHALLLAERPAEADAAYAAARRARPDLPDAPFGQAAVAVGAGQAERAQSLLDEALRADNAHLPSLRLLGQLAEQRGDLDAALAYYARADAPGAQGVVEYRRGRLQQALVLLERARATGDESAATLGHLGLALAELGRTDQARGVWSTLVERGQADRRLLANVARLDLIVGVQRARAGAYDEAAAAWERYLEHLPLDEQLRLDLAEADYRRARRVALHDPSAARAWFEEAAALCPEQPLYEHALALAELADGDTPAALERLRGLVERDGHHPGLAFHLGLALVASGQDGEARSYFERVSHQSVDPRLAGRATWALAILDAHDGRWDAAAERFLTASFELGGSR